MSKDDDIPERITVLAKDFTPAAMEFHRRNMSARGYRMEGQIAPRVYMLLEGESEPQPLLDGEEYYSVTFVRKDTPPSQ
ncbi:MAG: AMP nucleosidase [Alphaproteobacteria bacterium]|nr:AMP nucleosidase [Alphaproteobacteria bacterium]MBE8220207.1 AMP nucleosidase [Alphaproteobacteria bacterium]